MHGDGVLRRPVFIDIGGVERIRPGNLLPTLCLQLVQISRIHQLGFLCQTEQHQILGRSIAGELVLTACDLGLSRCDDRLFETDALSDDKPVFGVSLPILCGSFSSFRVECQRGFGCSLGDVEADTNVRFELRHILKNHGLWRRQHGQQRFTCQSQITREIGRMGKGVQLACVKARTPHVDIPLSKTRLQTVVGLVCRWRDLGDILEAQSRDQPMEFVHRWGRGWVPAAFDANASRYRRVDQLRHVFSLLNDRPKVLVFRAKGDEKTSPCVTP